ncbi:LytR/AlgR family response regulator transcription factor [Hugenholtzia roseola]|uniref:LytR/AlgR family response regulator transcription factor n=1 Tax=Hugenholtzia roseola TaxID=1002 RepID=UPI00047D68CC|nr:LytTR family DNA-binding domain-containing protein [Hugenholtzia roseola]
MRKLKCIVVDDEPIAQQILEKYISQIEALYLRGKCSNAFEALQLLHSEPIDLMFLDIQMPLLSGFEMLKTLQNPPKTILTTAFSEFGVESYEYGVVDYLLKPITFERFLKSINKVLMSNEVKFAQEKQDLEKVSSNFMFFKSDKKIYKYYFSEILFFEGSGNYIKIYTQSNKPLMILEKFSELQEKLPLNQFVRIHKSFIANITHITKIEGNQLSIHNQTLPISATFRQNLDDIVNNNK